MVKALSSAGAIYGFSLFVLVLQAVAVLAYTVCAVGLPFPPSEGTRMIYWSVILTIGLPAVASLLFAVVLSLGYHSATWGTAIADLILWILTAVWDVVAIVFFVIEYVNCEESYVCDSLISYGMSAAPGAAVMRWRFLAIFILNFAMLVLSALSAVVAFMVMKNVKDDVFNRISRGASPAEDVNPPVGCRVPPRRNVRFNQ